MATSQAGQVIPRMIPTTHTCGNDIFMEGLPNLAVLFLINYFTEYLVNCLPLK